MKKGSISKDWFIQKYEFDDGSTGYIYLRQEALTRRHHDVVLGAISEYQRHLSPDSTVVDIGCACGDFAAVVAERLGAQYVVGIDFVRQGLLIGQSRYPYIHFVEGALPELPLGESTAGLVLVMEVLYYLSESDQVTAVSNVWRATEQGGLVVVSINLGNKERTMSESDLLCHFSRGFVHLTTIYEHCLVQQKLHALMGRVMRVSKRYRIPGLYTLCNFIRNSDSITSMNYFIGRVVIGDRAKTKGVYVFRKTPEVGGES